MEKKSNGLRFLFVAAMTLTAQAQRPRGAQAKTSTAPPFSVVEATIPEMRAAMEQGRVTSRDVVVQYLTRIAMYEDTLNAVITVNPRAIVEAEARDRERREGKLRGPLHGIPIALKDNIHTTDMPTTGAPWPSRASRRPTRPPSPGTSRTPAPSSWPRP